MDKTTNHLADDPELIKVLEELAAFQLLYQEEPAGSATSVMMEEQLRKAFISLEEVGDLTGAKREIKQVYDSVFEKVENGKKMDNPKSAPESGTKEWQWEFRESLKFRLDRILQRFAI